MVVVDGGSGDGTREIASSKLAEGTISRARVLRNTKGTTPSNLNLGLAQSTGDIICRVDARSRIPPAYVAGCVDVLRSRPEVAVVGGAQVATAAEEAPVVARAIARALRNPYATGMSRYRRRARAGPGDTVYLGAFRKVDLEAERGWDERLLSNQDFELSRRMSRRGLIWFDPNLAVLYRPRATIPELLLQYRRFGRWKAAAWLERGVGIAPRQIALLVGPLLGGALGLALLRRRPRLALLALGALAGLLDAAVSEPAPLTERALSSATTLLVPAAWYLGIIEQAGRFTMGQRLLSGS